MDSEKAEPPCREIEMGEKLTKVMLRSLQAIQASGGAAIAEGGGWWKGLDGKRLSYEPPTPSVQTTVGTQTIYALADRGILQRRNLARPHRDTYDMTAKAHAALDNLDMEER